MTTPSAAGADLKAFDVPDPPRPAGWMGRCFVAGLLGLLVAAGLLRLLRLPHLAWVAEHHTSRWDRDSLGYIQSYALSEIEELYDPETVASYAVEMEDPRVRGALHEALATTKEPKHLDDMLAYLRAETHSYASDSDYDQVVASMLACDRGQAVAKLVAAYAEPGKVNLPDEFQSQLFRVLEREAKPEELAPHVVKIEDEVKRGRFHAALATTKDPAQIDAVLAYAQTVLPTDPGQARPAAWAPIVESLGSFGTNSTPKLESILQQTESRALVSLAAEALRASDLPFLVRRTQERLDEYDQAVPQLAQDFQVVSEVDAGETPEGVTDERIAEARANLAAADAKAFMIFEMLRAMEPVHGDQGVDFCIVRGLSTFNSGIAEWSVMRCKERFSPDKLVDTLFSYMAQKTQFKVSEVDVYEGLIKEMQGPGAQRVAQNLERLLAEAKGDTSEVFWLYKKMGFAILAEFGTAQELPTLRKFARDTEAYELTRTSTDPTTGRRTRTKEEKRFADDVRHAIEEIEGRASGAAPEESEEESSGEGE